MTYSCHGGEDKSTKEEGGRCPTYPVITSTSPTPTKYGSYKQCDGDGEMKAVDIRLDKGYVEIICDGGCISINKVRLMNGS